MSHFIMLAVYCVLFIFGWQFCDKNKDGILLEFLGFLIASVSVVAIFYQLMQIGKGL